MLKPTYPINIQHILLKIFTTCFLECEMSPKKKLFTDDTFPGIIPDENVVVYYLFLV